MSTRPECSIRSRVTGMNLALVAALSCNSSTTFQVLYTGSAPVGGLVVEVNQGGRTLLVNGNSFTTEGLGTPHSVPVQLPETGPTQAHFDLADPDNVPVVAGSLSFNAVSGTQYQMTLVYRSLRPSCAVPCPPIATFPSLLPGSADTMFVYLASPLPDGGISQERFEELRVNWIAASEG
jgi:hypothetical protein